LTWENKKQTIFPEYSRKLNIEQRRLPEGLGWTRRHGDKTQVHRSETTPPINSVSKGLQGRNGTEIA